MSDSITTIFPSGPAYINLAGRLQAKVFVVDDSVNPPQAGWITLETLLSGQGGSIVVPPEVMTFSDASTAAFSDGAPITFTSDLGSSRGLSTSSTSVTNAMVFSDQTAALFSDGTPILFSSGGSSVSVSVPNPMVFNDGTAALFSDGVPIIFSS